MIKEAGLFVISAAFLVYFISPVKEEPSPPPPKIETKTKAVSSISADAAYWGDDEYGNDDSEQEFVFGEPMVSTEPYSQSDSSSDSDKAKEAETNRETASRSVSPPDSHSSRTVKRQPIHSSSPKPGELGSAENPIPLD